MIADKPKVSIVSPCYNGEKYICRYLDAILKQDYENIQLIVVDDGSTDKTLSILESYKLMFSAKKYEYIILTKGNGGQASALNLGLQYADGEYLTWPDTDDFLFEDSISKRVCFLENHSSYGMVLSNGNEYIIENNDVVLYKTNVVKKYQAKKLLNSVLDMCAMFNNNGYLIRSNELWKVYPERKIYESRAGQNIQVLLPLALQCECGFLDIPLYGRVIHADSHSKQQKDAELRNKKLSEIFYHVLCNVGDRQAYSFARYSIGNLYSMLVYYKSIDKKQYSQMERDLRTIFYVVLKYRFLVLFHKIVDIFRGGKS